ncbi:hypothetical protein LLG07_00085, partial [bacterium]|nr:hypothetical protein [bacterium]
CIRQDCEVAKLEKEIADLKTELDRVQCDECMDLQDENIKLEEENAELESKLASIKYLDKKEVRKIFKGYCLSKRYDMQPFGIGLKGFGIEPFITAICKLAIPEINRDRIKKELNHENENLISVIFEIISRCFIDYEKLPKAEDICGILKSDKIIKKLGENNV